MVSKLSEDQLDSVLREEKITFDSLKPENVETRFLRRKFSKENITDLKELLYYLHEERGSDCVKYYRKFEKDPTLGFTPGGVLARISRLKNELTDLETGDGAVCRHHTREWLLDLLGAFEVSATREIAVTTMNGNPATEEPRCRPGDGCLR